MLQSFRPFQKKIIGSTFIVFCLLTWFWFSLPDPLFNDPTSTVILDSDGKLLSAKIAADEQWRFPSSGPIPEKFKIAVLQFEDRNFYFHPGINPASLLRAAWQNGKAKKVVSGGSTITMQTIRLARKNQPRTFFEKFIEAIWSVRLEISHSKEEILALYSSHAPFGGNVVGLEAASWRYFGRSSADLSWSEAATLAVLPNSPALIYPGKNHERLKMKRNSLLKKLRSVAVLDSLSCQLAMDEPLPGKPFPIPLDAPHLLTRVLRENNEGRVLTTTLNGDLQKKVAEIIEKHQQNFRFNLVNNAAALVLEVKTGNALAYIGNSTGKDQHTGNDVDMILSPRSTGSILKPFLFCAMLNDGEILPGQLVADVPMQLGSYSPKNFTLEYDGAVPAKRAIARSLNIPAVKMLQEYGVERFLHFLKRAGINTLNFSADHYGLSLILGGGEGTLWEIGGMYAGMARTLNHFRKYDSRYNRADFHSPQFLPYITNQKNQKLTVEENGLLNAAAIYLTFESMVEVARPDEEANWQSFSSLGKIAWKTGTSFGSRDAWAIGCNPEYVVAIWVGNANGEGRPGLTGIGMAAPVLFDIFNLLQSTTWFQKPLDDMTLVPICRQSGFRALDICEDKDSSWVQNSGLKTGPCPYHRLVHLDASEKWQVNSQCEPVENMHHRSWFVLPPVQEWYFKSKNPGYRPLPPYRENCAPFVSTHSMDLIYPKKSSKILIPVELDGSTGKTVFEVAHRNPSATIFWHLDNVYVGSTQQFHQLALNPPIGKHLLTLVDENGETLKQTFEIVAKGDQ